MRLTEATIFESALGEFVMAARHHQMGSLEDTLILDGVCWRLALGVNALAQLPEERLHSLVGPTWTDLWAIRNQITHDYISVRASTIEPVLNLHLDSLTHTLLCELGE